MNFYGPRQLADSMRTVRRNTIQIANDIPASHYDFRPTPEYRSVAELLVHIAWLASADRLMHEEQHIDTIEGFDFGALLETSTAEEQRPRSKEEIVGLLTTEGERYVQWVEQLPDAVLLERVRWPDGTSKSRFEMLVGTKEHEMQHRAQLTVVERLVGVVPHFTRNLRASLSQSAHSQRKTLVESAV
jgi:uncharacterized damage-inducible protein DinB